MIWRQAGRMFTFAVAALLLIMVPGLATWLPQLMRG